MIALLANDLSPNLLEFITQQQELIARQQEQIAQQQEQIVQLQERDVQQQIRIEALEAEIARLKKLNPKPNIKPNTKPPDDDDPGSSPPDSDNNGKPEASEDGDSLSRKSEVEKPDETTRRQRSQPPAPSVSEEHRITPEAIPEGSVRHGRESFTVQELEVKAKAVRYWLEQWLTPEGKTVSGRPPDNLNGHHFGPQLQAFVILQHYGCAVPQPQLLELLWDAGISISAGELSNLLTKGHDGFHAEKDELLATGIRCSHYLQTDDTGARHQGQNGYCTVIVNDLFTWFDHHMVTFSDGARQFDVFDHAQCWLHAERPLDKVIPVNEQQANAQYWCLNWFWDIYRDLKAFKAAPSEEMANRIRQGFDSLVHTQTNCSGLQAALGSLEVVKKELLLVLDDPTLPLHNNLSESQIREHVKRRKISGGTRSEAGRQCRDTFASLKKTCRQHGLSFWDYLTDRINGTGSFPRLADVIEYVSCWLPCGQCRGF